MGLRVAVYIVKESQKYIIKEDQILLLNRVSNYPFIYHIALCVGWKKIFDHASDHGSFAIKGMKNLVRDITYPDHATRKCSLCDIPKLDQITLAEHFKMVSTPKEAANGLLWLVL